MTTVPCTGCEGTSSTGYRGYANLETGGAEIVHVTRPHWLDDDS